MQDEGLSGQTALRHLSKLYSMALDLRVPSNVDYDLEGEESSDELWKTVFDHCSILPISYYSDVFDPHTVPGEVPVVGDLGDDLADIHRDLTRGLLLYRAGHSAEAEWDWRNSFWTHWGRHASSAIRALHSWFADRGW